MAQGQKLNRDKFVWDKSNDLFNQDIKTKDQRIKKKELMQIYTIWHKVRS
jgi:hypothetical protein